MKKFTSFLLMLTMLISIIYLPGLTFNISAAEQLPDGSYMMTTSYAYNQSLAEAGYIPVANVAKTVTYGGKNYSAILLSNVTVGKKYFLCENVTLGTSYSTIKGYSEGSGELSSEAIILDGAGYTIHNNSGKPIFRTLSTGSQVSNLIIDTNNSTHIKVTSNLSGYAAGSLAARTYGGIFKNIINKVNVTLDTNVTVEQNNYVRAGGIIGMALVGNVFFENCINKGNVTAGESLNGSNPNKTYSDGTKGITGGVGGILGYVHSSPKVMVLNCQNTGAIKNNLKTYAYSAGIVGSKSSSAALIINCSNTGTLTGATKTDDYCALSISSANYEQKNGVLPLASAADFANVKDPNSYYVKQSFSGVVQNKNAFTGKIYGFTRVIYCNEPPLADMSKCTLRELTIRVYGWTEIKTAEQFANIVNNGTAVDWNSKANTENKYYLAANIDLATSYPNWKGPSYWSGSDGNRKHAVNNQPTIFLDGCGFTVTTARPIFPELPGGGPENDGTHSTIRNLVVAGNVSVNKSYLTEYNNGYSAGALVGKSNGGIYENVTNNANILLTTDMSARVGGMIGSVFNDDITIKNCVNNGTVTAPISGELHGVGGILGLIGYNVDGSARGVHATLINCVNKGTVKNTSTSSSYAGGIIGVKYVNETTAFLLDCSNSGKIFAQTAYGSYYANRLQQNVHVIKTTPITTADEFMKMSGKKAYSLAADITLSSFNTNEFSGFLVGNGHTVTTPDRMFDYAPDARVVDTNIKLTSVVINGHKLGGFKVIAASKTDANAQKIVARFATYGANIEILTPADNYVGDAIYINLGNTYGNVRSGIDWEFTDDGDFHIYLDDSASIGTLVDRFLANNMPAGKSNIDFFSTFGEKNFTYNFGSAKSQGYTFTEREDGIRYLANGVRYISRDYTTSSGIAVNADILIIEANADAHVEVGAAASTTVSSCTNSANCDKIHVVPQTTTQLAESLRADGRRVIAAVNGGFFMRSAGLKYGCYTPWGMQIVDGVVNREPTNTTSALPYSNWFAITNEGKPVIGDFNDYNSTYKGKDLLKFGIGGKQFIMRNGKYIPNTSSTETSDAKTAIGYNAKGDIVIVSISGNDNDLTKHPGATLADVAQVFMDLDVDVTNILNLDGGGSTTMVFENSNNEIVRGSVQYGTTDNKVERPVSDIVAIVLNK